MPQLPENVVRFKSNHEEIWSAFEQMGKACHQGGPLDEKTRRLIKVAIAVGAGLEGATHSAVRHAKESGATQAELEQVAILAITTIGFPPAMRALMWLDGFSRSSTSSTSSEE